MCTSVMTQATQPSGDVGVDSTGLADRIVESTTATLEMFGLYLGNRLGLYQWLWDAGPSTVTELASGAGVDGRYAREWLEQQAVAGFISVDRCDASPHARRYWIPEAHVGALVHDTDPEHVAPLARMVVGIANVLDEVLAAYATGDGVPYEHYGADFRHGQGGINRPAFEHDLDLQIGRGFRQGALIVGHGGGAHSNEQKKNESGLQSFHLHLRVPEIPY